MVALTFRNTYLSEDPFYLSGVEALLGQSEGSSTWLYAGSQATGTITRFALSQGGGLGSPTTVELSGNGSVFRVSDLALIGDGSGAELLASRVHTQQINSFDIGNTGALSGQTQAISALAAPVTQIATITIGARDFLITGTRDAPGMQIYEWQASGQPALRDSVTDHAKVALGNVSDIATITVDGTPFLLTASAQDNAISSFHIAADGSATLIDSFGIKDGLYVSGLDSIASVSAHGTEFAVVGATGSSTLSLMRVNPMGVLYLEDHVIDSLATRFSRIDALATLSIGDRGFVLTGGGDDGIGLMEILPDYQLLAHGSLLNTPGGALSNLTALTTVTLGTEVQVIAAGQPGLTLATLDSADIAAPMIGTAAANSLTGSARQDLLWGGAGDDQLFGGAGDDVLMGGAGYDRMTGGAGADIFCLDDDLPVDRVLDFNLGEDRIDISRWGVQSLDALTIISRSYGAELRYGDLAARLYDDGGAQLYSSDFSSGDFIF
ncbi:calcium-binding protein [Roseovarius sp. CH_XMU1461]|uniref:calcium-binding protein n=1 Tax=Roseovarius sp. CH_XMU1461 TaxID=3107777 RepID=UPI003009A379